MRYVVIMAGGSGKRLWPLSRQGTPKQLLKLVGGTSLLRIAYERIQGVVPDENVLVCTGAAYAETVADEIPEIPRANLLGEPEGRDSLNAVAWPAAVLAERDPEAVVAMITADALMEPEAAFRTALDQAFAIAEADPLALVTFGVVPTSPHTGYGYLHQGADVAGFPGAREIRAFKEKPDRQTAERYVESQEYWWNGGMFVWRAQTLLTQLRQLKPETYAKVVNLADHPELVEQIFPTLEKISVDYAIMEPVGAGKTDAHVVGVPLPITWHDVGGFAALAEQVSHDGNGNALEGLVVSLDSHGNLILNRNAEGHLVGVVGCSGMVIVAMPDVTMVCPLTEAESVKRLVAQVAAQNPDFA